MLARLNKRYYEGRISNVLEEAGVLVHVLDGGVKPNQPWLDNGRSFISVSLLNAMKVPHGLYSGGIALVISPSSRLICSYPQDSGTKSWTLSKVEAYTGHAGCGPIMCSSSMYGNKGQPNWPPPRRSSGYPCAFPPSMFDVMMGVFHDATVEESSYTEIVIDNHLFAIEAIVGFGYEGRYVHGQILSHFGLNENQLPLLRWGPGLKENHKCARQDQCPLFVA